MSISVIIADDHAVFRQGLDSLLSQAGELDIHILGHAEDGNEAVSLVEETKPDVLIIDISMPGLNGIDATRIICKKHPSIKVIGLSMHKRLNYILHMLQAGAHAYILKESAVDDVIEAIQAVLRDEYYFSQKLNLSTSDILKNLKKYSQNLAIHEKLSPRERQVLQLIAEGKGTKEVARMLHRSVKTVESHRKNIMEKLDIHTVAELTAYAIREGMVQLDP